MMVGRINTTGQRRAGDFLDHSTLATAGVLPLHHADTLVDGSTTEAGDSRQEVFEKHLVVCRKVLLKPKLSVCIDYWGEPERAPHY